RDRGEQDELLAQRVEGADVEVQRRDDVGGVPERGLGAVDEGSIELVRVAETRQAGKRDQQHGRQATGSDAEQPQTYGPAHSPSSSALRFSCWRILRRAARMISGSPIPATTISDRATSGAWKVK